MKFLLTLIGALSILAACSEKKHVQESAAASASPPEEVSFMQNELTRFVNPFIGTGGHGHTYPGATAPFGMVQLSPDTRLEGWDGCGGYHYSDTTIYGFSHTHLQGTGVPDYGDILFMPTNYKTKRADQWKDAYKSSFDHGSEIATPGYYAVDLKDYSIRAEMTATTRTGIHRYQLAKGDSCRMFIDMMHRDELLYYDIGTIGDTAIWGYRVSKAWAEEQHCYFYAVFSRPFHDFTQLDIMYDDLAKDGTKKQVIEQVQVFSLEFAPGEDITVKVGISGVDADGAKNNLYSEAPHWNFDQYRQEADNAWQTCLSKARIEETDKDELFKYYTALYHCYTVPNTWSDVDHRFRGMDKKIHLAQGYTRYTVFSLWDTFRAYHPLMAELEPERTRDWIKTFLDIYRERGELPVWELAANETYCMIGYHSIPVITDAYMRGIRDFDTALALEAMIASASGPQKEKLAYDSLGYVPGDRFSESVSKTLEFAYDDWCIAQFAKALGNEPVYRRFIIRAQNWKNVYDPETRFMRPRRNGGFAEPFDPYQVDFNYTEANAWQYSYFVPHDIETLIAYAGGRENFFEDVNGLFTAADKTTGREQADITGLIGQYAHGNEPSHHAAFLFNYGSTSYEPPAYATSRQVKKIMKEMYQNSPDGLCGNEDCGQMSAWYVLARNGIYPILPGQPEFITFDIDNENLTYYIGSKKVRTNARPVSQIVDHLQDPIPAIQGPQTAFREEAIIRIYGIKPMKEMVVVIEEKGQKSFESKFNGTVQKHIITNDADVKIYSIDGRNRKLINEAHYRKLDGNRKITLKSVYDAQYTAGGDEALIDGLRGTNDFRTGVWQGYHGKDVEVIVDLGKEQAITTVGISCLEDIKSWIWFPSSIDIEISHDGKSFAQAAHIDNTGPVNDYAIITKEFTTNLRASGRYVRIIAHPAFKAIPEWHPGAGNPVWIFADEIIVR